MKRKITPSDVFDINKKSGALILGATRFSDCASCIFNPRPIFKYVVDIDNDHKKAI